MTRKQKIALHLVCIALSCAVLWALFPTEAPTAIAAFRKAEKRQMVGPAEIVETLALSHSWYDRMMIGISEHGLTVFSWNSDNRYDEGRLRYFSKNGSITLFCLCPDERMTNMEGAQIPFFAIAEHPNAVSATLLLELCYEDQTELIELQAQRSKGGYFLFSLYRDAISDQTRFHMEMSLSSTYLDGQVIGHVTLFDRQGEEIASKTMDLTKP